MVEKNYQLGIVGFGGMADWHNELIQSIEGLTVAGVYDIKKNRMDYAKSIGLNIYESLEEMLDDDKVDIILVATPNDVHKPIAIQAMEAGKAVVSEKPITLGSLDLEEMIHTSERTGCFLTVHQNRRWDEDFLTMKKIYEEKMLGDTFRIESRVHGSRGIPGDWRQEKEHGGGMVLDWGVHLLDQILIMMGNQKLRYVYASVTNITNQLVDDGFTTELEFENGVRALIEVGTNNFINLPRWYMLGQDGTAIIETWERNAKIVKAVGINETDVVPVRTAAGLTKTMAPRREDTIHTEELQNVKSDIRDFYCNVMHVLSGKEETLIKLSQVMRVMKLMEAIFESAAKRQVIEFEK
jgi:predicted dehydrogenase